MELYYLLKNILLILLLIFCGYYLLYKPMMKKYNEYVEQKIKDKGLNNMKEELLQSLYRHWIWAAEMKLSHENARKESKIIDEKENTPEETLIEFFTIKMYIFMFIWWGLVFCMCEAFKKKEIIIPDIQKDIDDIYDDLRRFRNAIFHVQDKFVSHKFRKLLTNKDFLVKIENIHNGIKKYLDNKANTFIKIK